MRDLLNKEKVPGAVRECPPVRVACTWRLIVTDRPTRRSILRCRCLVYNCYFNARSSVMLFLLHLQTLPALFLVCSSLSGSHISQTEATRLALLGTALVIDAVRCESST